VAAVFADARGWLEDAQRFIGVVPCWECDEALVVSLGWLECSLDSWEYAEA